MKTTVFTGADLLQIGYNEGKILGQMLHFLNLRFVSEQKTEGLEVAKSLLARPEDFLDNELWEEIATKLIEDAKTADDGTISLNPSPMDFTIYGEAQIEEGAKKQMRMAMRLPITVAGALMPDAHQGYGLPIGGVLATKGAIIPYGVGVDIGCRMALSIFDIAESHFFENPHFYKRELIAHTKFGAGAGFHGQYKANHAVLDRPEFDEIEFVRNLKDKAFSQLGSSGGGNHFVEWGIIEFAEPDALLNVPAGRYLALLSHSGSRGTGATIAGHYTRLAKSLCKLPSDAANLAYLSMDSAEGQEYWLAMNLAGDYASACHEIIHQKLTKAIGAQVLAKIENHHNFAWKENWRGEEVMVHRKGATPAAKNVMGIIPGSMTAPGFLVRGKGEIQSINSASHGAGRQMSRTQAIKNITKAQMKAILAQNGVTLIGAGLDEAPMAYKDIYAVMQSQTALVDTVATFFPKMVRMADDGSRED